MLRPELSRIHDAMRAKGYKVFDSPKGYDVNIVGIRASDRVPDVFDDLLTISWVDRGSGDWCHMMWNCTTDSGLDIIENPPHKDGAPFLAPGQYRGSHMLRLHAGKYRALGQKWGTSLPVYRMNNIGERTPEAIDWTPSFTLMGNGQGINIHRARSKGVTPRVANWSAGCQVFEAAEDFQVFLSICESAKDVWGNSFSYTLLDEADLDAV